MSTGHDASDRAVAKRVRRLLRSLDIRPPLSLPELCERLGDARGRPLHVRAHEFDVPGPIGMLITTSTSDVVLYHSATTPVHQRHIVLHEIGHLLADHGADDGAADPRVLAVATPNLSADVVRRVLMRDGYDDAQEREAETVATIIMEWAAVLDRAMAPVPLPRAGDPVVDGLGDRVGWL